MLRIAMLGTGLIGRFYTESLQSKRARDRVQVVYSRSEERAREFAAQYDVARHTTDLQEAVSGDDVDAVVIGLPNYLHEEAVVAAAEAGKAVLCTKPLGRNAEEALRMLQAVESAGVFHAYLEDLVYTPKTLKALASVRRGAVGDVLWVRSRETHPGPHSDWFWEKEKSGGGAIVDMGCHCIEIARNFIGKDIRPVEVVCWADTLVHPIEAEDNAVGMVRYANGGDRSIRSELGVSRWDGPARRGRRNRGYNLVKPLAPHGHGDVLGRRRVWLRRRKGRERDWLVVSGGRRTNGIGVRRHVRRRAIGAGGKPPTDGDVLRRVRRERDCRRGLQIGGPVGSGSQWNFPSGGG